MRAFRPDRRRAQAAGVPGGCLWPEMRFVYDAQARVKHECRSCFAVDGRTGTPSVTSCGEYYKNVRSEWASLVTTPPTARFQDALAFTRSIGDLHLHAYGVSHDPFVAVYDLCDPRRRPNMAGGPSFRFKHIHAGR